MFHAAAQSQIRQTDDGDSPSVALVLAGGGALGFAHIGVIRAIEEAGVDPDIVIGASIGSIVGALYSAGYDAEEMETLVTTNDWKDTFFDKRDRSKLPYWQKAFYSSYHFSVALTPSQKATTAGAFHAQHVVELLDRLLEKYPAELDFDTLPRKFRAVAADLVTGERVVYDKGDLKTVIRASMAVPGIFTPIEYKGRYLIDGGWADNTPSQVAKAMGADIIIVVPLGGLKNDIEELKTIAAVSSQADQIRIRERIQESLSAADLIIAPDLQGFTAADFERGSELVAVGYEAAKPLLPELRKISALQRSKREAPKPPVNIEQKLHITSITINGELSEERGNRLKEYLDQNITKEIARKELREKIYALYDDGSYAHIWYRLLQEDDGYQLIIDEEPQQIPRSLLSLGLNIEGTVTKRSASYAQMSAAYISFISDDLRTAALVQTWISEMPSFKAGLARALFWNALMSIGGYIHQDPHYFYDDDEVSAIYSLQRFGGDCAILLPFRGHAGITIRPYGEYRYLDRFIGDSLFEQEGWSRYGINGSLSIDTLDRILTPKRGIYSSIEVDYGAEEELNDIVRIDAEGNAFLSPSSRWVINPWALSKNLLHGTPRSVDLPAMGGTGSLDGYYRQEIRSENLFATGLRVRRQIGNLPLGFGNEIYAQLAASGGVSWKEDWSDIGEDPLYYSGAALGIIVNTIIGEAQISMAINDEYRFSGYIGLRNKLPTLFDR